MADQQIILEEEIDENYEPTEQEVLEYGQWLGMDVEVEKELLWIAREGLKAPLPQSWKPCKTPTSDIYYFNFATGESIWDHPCDDHYRKLYQEEKLKQQQQQQLEHTPPSTAAASPARTVALQSTPTGANHTASAEPSLKLLASSGGSAAAIRELAPLDPTRGKTLSSSGSFSGAGPLPLGTRPKPLIIEQPAQASPTVASPALAPLRTITSPTFSTSVLESDRPPSSRGGDSLQSSYAESPISGIAVKSPLGALNREPLGSLNKGANSLSALPHLTSTSPSGSGNVASSRGDAGGNTSSGADWRADEDERDSTQRKAYRQKLDDQREIWEQQLAQAEEAANAEAQQASNRRLDSQQDELAEREEAQRTKLVADHNQQLTELKQDHEDVLREQRQAHAARLALLKTEHDALEAGASSSSARLKQVSTLDNELTTKHAAAAEADALLQEKQRQLSSLEIEIRSKTITLEQLTADMESRRSDAQAVEAQLAAQQAKLSDLTSEIAAKGRELSSIASHLSLEQAGCSSDSAARTSAERSLTEATSLLTMRKADLAAVEADMAARRAELTGVVAELARQRLEAITQDVSLAAQLREKAAGEFSTLEEQLSRAQSQLAGALRELTHREAELRLVEARLPQVTAELEAKQRASIELGNVQAQLAEVTATLVDKRCQLDSVASALLSKQAELDYETAKRQLSSEERTLLELQRLQMQRTVADSLEAERQALLASKMAVMRAEVERAVSEQRDAYYARRKEQVLLACHHDPALGAAPAVAGAAAGPEAMQPKAPLHHPTAPEAASAAAGAGATVGSHESSDGASPAPLHSISPRVTPEGLRLWSTAGGRSAGGRSAGGAAAPAAPLSGATSAMPHGDVVKTTESLHRSLQALLTSTANGGTAGSGLPPPNKQWPRYDGAVDVDVSLSSEPSGNNCGITSEPSSQFAPHLRHAGGRMHGGTSPHGRSSSGANGVHDDSLTQLAAATSSIGAPPQQLLSKAHTFLRQQKRYIKERQAAVAVARDSWRADVAEADTDPEPMRRHQRAALLRQVKGALEDQVQRLNQDAAQLRSIKQQVLMLEAAARRNRAAADRAAAHTVLPAAASDDDSRSRGGVGRRAAGGGRAHGLRASLEKISRALSEAISAAAAAPLRRGNSAGGALQRRSGGGRSLTPEGAYVQRGVALNEGRGHHKRSSSAGQGVLPSAWLDHQVAGEESTEWASLEFLSKWKDERDVARSLLHQHSAWLRSFQQQISKAGEAKAARNYSAPQASMRSSSPTRGRFGSTAAFVGGHSQRGVPTSLSAGGPTLPTTLASLGVLAGRRSSNGGTYPMTLDIGNNQEIVIAVRSK